jgi:hypothetical protein
VAAESHARGLNHQIARGYEQLGPARRREIAVVNSAVKIGSHSRVWLLRGTVR